MIMAYDLHEHMPNKIPQVLQHSWVDNMPLMATASRKVAVKLIVDAV